MDCFSSCQVLKAQRCSSSANGSFNAPSTPHPPPPPTPYRDSIPDITGAEKTYQKTSGIQVASRISYGMIAI